MAHKTLKLKFRTATLSDVPQIQHLVQSAFRADDSRQDWIGSPELAASFQIEVDEVRACIINPDTFTIVAFATSDAADKPGESHAGQDESNSPDPPAPVATIVVTLVISKRGTDVGRLSMIAVDESFQRCGLGRQVLEYAEEYCQRTWGVSGFSLNALSTRKALIAWYLRRGYQRTGESTPFPRENMRNLDILEDLCFVEMEKNLV